MINRSCPKGKLFVRYCNEIITKRDLLLWGHWNSSFLQHRHESQRLPQQIETYRYKYYQAENNQQHAELSRHGSFNLLSYGRSVGRAAVRTVCQSVISSSFDQCIEFPLPTNSY